MRDRRSMVGLLVTRACDRGNGWIYYVAGAGSVIYCYPIGCKRPRAGGAP